MKRKPKPTETKAEKYEREIIEVIRKHRLFQVTDIFAFYAGCSRATFYNMGLERLDSILKELENNRTLTKQSLKLKWFKSDNPTLQVALFKLLADNDEHKKLSLNHTDVTSNGNSIAVSFVPVPDATTKDD